MAEHSPLPWVNGGAGAVYSGDDFICDTWLDEVSTVESYANADLIVRAVNSNDALLEACKAAIRICESRIHDDLDGTAGLDAALAELNPIQAAIAKAEGRAP